MHSKITLEDLAELLYDELDVFPTTDHAMTVLRLLNAEGVFDPSQVEDAI